MLPQRTTRLQSAKRTRDGDVIEATRVVQDVGTQYEEMEEIGEGTFGCCFVVAKADRLYAMKEHKVMDAHDGLYHSHLREITMLRRLSHPHLVRLHHLLVEEEEPIRSLLQLEDGTLEEVMYGFGSEARMCVNAIRTRAAPLPRQPFHHQESCMQ